MNTEARCSMPLLTVCLWLTSVPVQVPAAVAQQIGVPQSQVPPDLLPYLHARTVVNFSQSELIEFIPELKRLEFSQDQEQLAPILKKVGEAVEAFVKDFPNVTALEQVYQERVEPGGNNEEYLKRNYNYVISANSDADGFGFGEYRTSVREEALNPGFGPSEFQGTYFVTSGHASASLYFHPRQMPACDFRYLGREKSDRRAHVIAFAQKPEISRMTGTITLVGNEIVLLKQGVAWIDPETYQVLRIRSELLLPRKDVGLEQHSTVVEYGEVRFTQASRSLWLPREVRVYLKWQGWRFQNRHRYTRYRLFTVESRDGEKKPVRPD